MIESGSCTPGIRSGDFGIPIGTALRIERPAEPLRDLFPGYAVLDSDPALWSAARNWRLPGWAQIRIVLTSGPIDLTFGQHAPTRLGAAMLLGVTSRAMPASTNGGVSVLIDVSPLAWARLFAPSAETLRDRITPLATMLPSAWSEDLIARLVDSDRGRQVKAVLDDFFVERLPPPHPHEALMARIAALLADAGTHDLADAAAQVGIDARALLGLTKRYFGFAPKMLTMRTRFLRALTAMLVSPNAPDFSVIPAGYHDASHFIRDANRFLGLTPRRFMAIDMPYTRAVLRARSLVLGGATGYFGMLERGSTTRASAAQATKISQ